MRLATLHYHFANKEALLLAVLEALNAEMTQRAFARGDRTGDTEDRLERMIRNSWRQIMASRERQIAQFELTLYALRTKGSEWLAERQYTDYVSFYAEALFDGDEAQTRLQLETAEQVGRFVLCGIDGLILQFFAMRNEAEASMGLEALIAASRDLLRRTRM